MLTLLLALVAPPGPAGPSEAEVIKRLTAQLRGAVQRMVQQPAQTIDRLTALLDDADARAMEGRSLAVRSMRDQARYMRAQMRVQQGDAQAVVEEMTELLERKRVRFIAKVAGVVAGLAGPTRAPLRVAFTLPPRTGPTRWDWSQPLAIRGQALQRLGRHDEAQADTATMLEILRATAGYAPQPPRPFTLSPPSGVRLPALALLLAPVAFAVTAPIFFLAGLRQRRDGRGTWVRLTWVALTLAAAQAAPLLAAAAMVTWRPGLLESIGIAGVTLGVFAAGIALHLSYVTAVTWMHTRTAPPLLEDAAVLDRVSELAGRMGVPVPVTRLARSGSAQQMNEALIAGVAAPTLLLFDGILYRMTAEERDAIIAHELGHLANHTFWWRLLVSTGCGVAAVAAGAFVSPAAALALGWCLFSGSQLILSRALELDCDRRAAAALGRRRAAAALWNVHADQPFRSTPVLEFLIGAVSTHPSRDERLAAVAADAPPDDRPEVVWDAALLGRRRLAAWAAAGLWLAVTAGSLAWAVNWPNSTWPALPPVAAALTPTGLLWLGMRKALRRRSQLMRRPWTWWGWLGWLIPAALVGCLAADWSGLAGGLFRSVPGALTLAGLGVICLILLPLANRGLGWTQALELKVQVAIQSGDYAGGLKLCDDAPNLVAGSPALRHNRAMLLALTGRREEAVAGLEAVVRDVPSFKISLVGLASLYAEDGRFTEALELARTLSRDLPDEQGGARMEAWCLLKLGRLDEAEARLAGLEDEQGEVSLIRGGVAIEHGDLSAARDHLARAARLAPGTVGVALLEAELALAAGAPDAEAAVNRVCEAVRNNPLAFAEREADTLTRRLAERRAGTVDEVEVLDGPPDES